jgi:hypothetical protein
MQKPGETDLTGRRYVVAVDGGFLVGFNAGEFGGGAWWFSADGTRHRKLTLRRETTSIDDYVAENVHGFAVVGKDVLAFEGLTHGGLNAGQIVRLSRASDGTWDASLFSNLPACPHAILQESGTRWLLATTQGIWRVHADARIEPVWQVPGGHLYYPNSLVRDRVGILYMGMRDYVVRLAPHRDATYSVDVLVPP